jgi:hypothetical protein
MAAKLGSTTASLYLGSTPVAAYLGAEQVYSAATVPGAPTITVAEQVFDGVAINFTEPADDGGSPLTAYKIYLDGALVFEGLVIGGVLINEGGSGDVVEMSAVNAVGEGPKSAPVTVT